MIAYFDNCATTRVDDDIIKLLDEYHSKLYFNPSARSTYSLNIFNELSKSRERIAKCLGAMPEEIFFTSGGTEADNLAILGAVRQKHGNIVCTAVEHSAVYNTVMELKNRGIEIRFANVLSDGHIDIEDFVAKVDGETLMAIFMHVNNETGAVNDVALLNKRVKSVNSSVVTFSDGVQAVGKIPVNIKNLGVDLYSFSGHKLHSSKGTGCLFVKKGTRIAPIVFGGGQENGLRSGTEYVAGQIALSYAVEKATALVEENDEHYLAYKNVIVRALSELSGVKFNCVDNVSPAILSVAFQGIKGEVLLHMLEQYEIIVGTGSACSSKSKQSRVAKAIGVPLDYSEGILRISFSKYNTLEEVNFLAEKLVECVKALRKVIYG